MKIHHVCERGEMHTQIWWGNLRERNHLKDPGVDGRIKLKFILKKPDGRVWNGFIWLMMGEQKVAGFCKRGNETSSS
jgi:hypothetical protein